MDRTRPNETELVICVKHPFTLWNPTPEMPARVRERWPEMKVVHLPDYNHLVDQIPDTDIFVGYSIRPEQFRHARKLKWIHSTAAGVAQLMYPELRARGILLTNARGVHSVPIAEHALGMLLALARRFPSALRYQRERCWAQQEIWDEMPRPAELAGQTLLLVGFGAVGQALAQRAKPLGMKICAVTRSGRGDPSLADRILPAAELDHILPEADYIVLAAPETPDTHHLIGSRQLGAMKPTAYLVNVARGSLLDEAALVKALRRRAIAGAALDVTEQEPLPPASPLWALDNVFLTPHLAGASETLWHQQTELLLENLERWFSGCELLSRVDLKRGY